MVYLVGILPAIMAVYALKTYSFHYKAGVTLSCMLIIFVAHLITPITNLIWIILAALTLSIIGDYFLSNKRYNSSYYLYGVVSYLLAHMGYLAFTLIHGSLIIWLFMILLVAYGIYYVYRLSPAIKDRALALVAFLYLILSCLSLATAVGLATGVLSRFWMSAGIVMIVLSDTIIAEGDFAGNKHYRKLILPTYYLAHIFIMYSLLTM